MKKISARVVILAALAFVPGPWFGSSRLVGVLRGLTGWTLVLERPSIAKYEDFAFPDSRHGWLVAASGDVLHTADSGITWKLQASGLGPLRSVDFLDQRRGFAGTLTGTLFATTDGGSSWTDITTRLPKSAKGFCGMTHVGLHVHIVGRYLGDATDYFYSVDAGKTWRTTDLSNVAHGLVSVAFTSESVGFIGGMGKSPTPGQPGTAIILKTTDGGQHWRRVFEHNGGRGFVWKLFPVSTDVIYAALQSEDGVYRVAKTTDGGEKWHTMTVAVGRPPGAGIQGVGFLDANRGWVGGFFFGMYATTNGGRSWVAVPTPDAVINKYVRAGTALLTAGTRGILRYDQDRAGR